MVAHEAEQIEKAVKRVTSGYQRALAEWWPTTDVHSGDFFGLVARRFEGEELKVTVTGLPVWLHADSHSLALAVEAWVRAWEARIGGAGSRAVARPAA